MHLQSDLRLKWWESKWTGHMKKNDFWLFSFIGVLCNSIASAEVEISIQAIEPQVWIQQDNSRSALQTSTKIKLGEVIIAGKNGHAQLLLDEEVALQINANTEVSFVEDNKKDATITELQIHKGQICVQYRPNSDNDKQIKLNIGSTMFITMSFTADICALRFENKSSIELLGGSVQVTHFVDSNLIILSKSGTEFGVKDNGSYQLTVPGVSEPLISEATDVDVSEISTEEIVATKTDDTAIKITTETDNTAKAIIEPEPIIEASKRNPEVTETQTTNISDEILETIDTYISEPKKPAEIKTDPAIKEKPVRILDKNKSERVYTVYLFSTRSEEVAIKANLKFQKANHNTQIITSNDGSVVRYRVAVSGFTSLQTAKDFSSSIIGKLGVSDTWIGKQ